MIRIKKECLERTNAITGKLCNHSSQIEGSGLKGEHVNVEGKILDIQNDDDREFVTTVVANSTVSMNNILIAIGMLTDALHASTEAITSDDEEFAKKSIDRIMDAKGVLEESAEACFENIVFNGYVMGISESTEIIKGVELVTSESKYREKRNKNKGEDK